jgi:hypothetical protein
VLCEEARMRLEHAGVLMRATVPATTKGSQPACVAISGSDAPSWMVLFNMSMVRQIHLELTRSLKI